MNQTKSILLLIDNTTCDAGSLKKALLAASYKSAHFESARTVSIQLRRLAHNKLCAMGAAILVALLFVCGTSAQAQLVASATAIDFGSQPVGSLSAPIEVTLHNISSEVPIVINSVSSSLGQFSYLGPAFPVLLQPGQGIEGLVTFNPAVTTTYRGYLIVRGATGFALVIPLIGKGTGGLALENQSSPLQVGLLTSNVQALNFGNVKIGSSGQQTVTFSNAGNASIVVSNVILSGAGFSASGISSGLMLGPNQTVVPTVSFTPAASGNATGNVTVVTDVGSTTVTLAGVGISASPVVHSVTFWWDPSVSDVIGYSAYSSTVSGGPYTRLTAAPITSTSYVDAAVQGGETHYYVVTAVYANKVESIFSNEMAAIVP